MQAAADTDTYTETYNQRQKDMMKTERAKYHEHRETNGGRRMIARQKQSYLVASGRPLLLHQSTDTVASLVPRREEPLGVVRW